MDKDVFCLAGANGLGKSTFLNIVNYILTGIVINPEKEFSSTVSTSVYYSNMKKFASSYFDGRVDEFSRDIAEATVEFSMGEYEYSVTRNFFETEGIVDFKKTKEGQNLIDSSDDESVLFELYREHITEDIGLATFDQFVFIQHYILTFDEHHHLLFWDKTLMETALYLFFGVDAEEAKKANALRKRINQLGSNVRNFVYARNRSFKEAEELKGQIDKLKARFQETEPELDEYTELLAEKESIEEQEQKNTHQVKLTELEIANISIELADLRSQYQNTFDSLMSPPLDISKDKNVLDLLVQLKNKVCSQEKISDIQQKLESYIKENLCECNEATSEEDTSKLVEIDNQIKHCVSQISEQQAKKDRLISEIATLNKNCLSAQKRIIQIEAQHADYLKYLKSESDGDLSGLLKSYYEQIETKDAEILEKKNEKREKEKELKKLERNLHKSFTSAEKKFLPTFQRYVSSFLGLDVAVKFRSTSAGAFLTLDINNSERTDIFQLSESQRYFVDIGLRMALVDFACSQATLLIDTPEGSLDIAYESKAGKMFAGFARTEFKLLMTANINTSELLLELAERCTQERMTLEKMTDWTYLSEVQIQESAKIEHAFSEIESHLEASET